MMHRPLGRAAFVVHAPFAPPGGGAHLSAASAGGLGGYAMVRFGFFVFGAFWAAAKCAKHSCVLNRVYALQSKVQKFS